MLIMDHVKRCLECSELQDCKLFVRIESELAMGIIMATLLAIDTKEDATDILVRPIIEDAKMLESHFDFDFIHVLANPGEGARYSTLVEVARAALISELQETQEKFQKDAAKDDYDIYDQAKLWATLLRAASKQAS